MEQSALEKIYKTTGGFWSPSNFDATNGVAQEWNLNSAGNLNPWGWIHDTFGARQIPTTIENSSMNRKVYG